MYKVVYAIFYLLSLLPFRLLYCLSDLMYVILYMLLRYRRKLVRKNLSLSFPEKSDKERRTIEHKFYHWFCDYFVEAIKLLSISEKEIRKRLDIVNADKVVECFQEGQNAAGMLGHYCNWEWLSCFSLFLRKGDVVGLIYHPLRNKYFNKLFLALRSHVEGGVPIPKNDILRYAINYKNKGISTIFGYIYDQGPKYKNTHLWLNFLNQETPVFTGAERVIRKLDNAVFYLDMTRPKRGYYKCTFKLITRHPKELPEHELTRRFYAMLEETIRRAPEHYLWSHNRWKRTKEEFDRRYVIENGRVVPRYKKKEDGDA